MATLTIDEVKLYLRLDDESEDFLIESLLNYSKEEIKDATGATNENYGELESYKMLQKIIIVDRYENRGANNVDFKMNNIYSSICTKLKLKVAEDDESSE